MSPKGRTKVRVNVGVEVKAAELQNGSDEDVRAV
jgi:hypothetical protein